MGNESKLSFCPHNGIGVVDDCAFVAGVECFSGKTKIDTVAVAWLQLCIIILAVNHETR